MKWYLYNSRRVKLHDEPITWLMTWEQLHDPKKFAEVWTWLDYEVTPSHGIAEAMYQPMMHLLADFLRRDERRQGVYENNRSIDIFVDKWRIECLDWFTVIPDMSALCNELREAGGDFLMSDDHLSIVDFREFADL